MDSFLYLLILMFLSAFFSASETALSKISKLKASSDKKLKKITSKADEMISTILILNNISNITFSSLVTMLISEKLGVENVPMLMTIITIVFILTSEITPKILVYDDPYRFSLKIAPIINILMLLISPINKVINLYTSFLKKILRLNKKAETTTDEIKEVVNDAHECGIIDTDELNALNGILNMKERKITEIFYVKKEDIVSVNYNNSYDKIYKVFKESGYSRIPVFKDNKIMGMICNSDFLFTNKKGFKIKKVIREILVVEDTEKVDDVIEKMKESRIHMAIIKRKDSIVGLTTLEICTELILGDIYDETDD